MTQEEMAEAFAAGNNDFAFDLLAELSEHSPSENLVFSPFSISLALSELFGVVGPEAAAQMADTMHFDLSPEQLHAAFTAVQSTMNESVERAWDKSELALEMATSAWTQTVTYESKPFAFSPMTDLRRPVRRADFNKAVKESRDAINQWAYHSTGGLVNESLPEGAVTEQTTVAIAASLLFHALWRNEFHIDDGELLFTPLEGGTVPVDGMSRTTSLQYYDNFSDLDQSSTFIVNKPLYGWLFLDYETEVSAFEPPVEDLPLIEALGLNPYETYDLFHHRGELLPLNDVVASLGPEYAHFAEPVEPLEPHFRAVQLPFDGSRDLSMLILLPEEGRFADFETSLSSELIDEIVAGLRTCKVDVTLPVFQTDQQAQNLGPALADMGMPALFGPESLANGYLASLHHGAAVSLDEVGVDAGAATTAQIIEVPPASTGATGLVDVSGSGFIFDSGGQIQHRTFTADRPFIYLVRHEPTNTTLFVGRKVE